MVQHLKIPLFVEVVQLKIWNKLKISTKILQIGTLKYKENFFHLQWQCSDLRSGLCQELFSTHYNKKCQFLELCKISLSTGSTVLPLGLIYLHSLNQIKQIDHKFYIYQEKIVPFNSDSESDDDSQGNDIFLTKFFFYHCHCHFY